MVAGLLGDPGEVVQSLVMEDCTHALGTATTHHPPNTVTPALATTNKLFLAIRMNA